MERETTSVKIISVSVNEVGQRIDNFLHARFQKVPKSVIYRILRKGEVRVNSKRIQPKYKINLGDQIRIPPVQTDNYEKLVISPYLSKVSTLSKSVLYEDGYILVLNKPAGIAVHGGSGLIFGVIEGLRALRPKENFLELVHRLDRDTSGVLLIAKKRSALCALHDQFRTRKIEKSYLALVRGQWPSCVRSVQAPLLKNFLQSGKWIIQVNQKGKFSKTYFRVKERYTSATLLSCNPVTGRTHQIRVHAQHIGHPVAFDNRYGDYEFNKTLEKTGLSHLFLHATNIKFIHPNTGETISIDAPMDDQLKQSIKILRTEM